MAYALVLGDQAREVTPGFGFTDADGVQHPPNWFEVWSPQQRTAKGVRVVPDLSPPDVGKRRASVALQVINGAPAWVATDEPIPLAEQKAAKLQAVRDRRWVAENAGVTVNGVSIRTDERTQAKVTGGILLMQVDPSVEALDWEAQANAYVALDLEALQAVGKAIGAHVQACFTRSRELSEAIVGAANAAALVAIDIEAGWPG